MFLHYRNSQSLQKVNISCEFLRRYKGVSISQTYLDKNDNFFYISTDIPWEILFGKCCSLVFKIGTYLKLECNLPLNCSGSLVLSYHSSVLSMHLNTFHMSKLLSPSTLMTKSKQLKHKNTVYLNPW